MHQIRNYTTFETFWKMICFLTKLWRKQMLPCYPLIAAVCCNTEGVALVSHPSQESPEPTKTNLDISSNLCFLFLFDVSNLTGYGRASFFKVFLTFVAPVFPATPGCNLFNISFWQLLTNSPRAAVSKVHLQAEQLRSLFLFLARSTCLCALIYDERKCNRTAKATESCNEALKKLHRTNQKYQNQSTETAQNQIKAAKIMKTNCIEPAKSCQQHCKN